MARIITGLDIGSTNIRAAVCSMDTKGRLTILALDNMPSNGIDSGNIVNFDVACNDLIGIIRKLEKQIKRKIRYISATISGSGMAGLETSGMVGLSKRPRQIWQRDVDKCVKTAEMVKIPEDRQIVQKAIHSFYINEGDLVDNPIGMYATKLGIKMYLVTAEIAKIKNLYKCVEHTGYILDNVVFSESAIAESILTDENREGVTALIDIGSHLTSIALFKHKSLKYINCLPKGMKDPDVIDEPVTLLRQLKESIKNTDLARVIVTGGGALKENVLENAEKSFGITCEFGRVKLDWCSLNPSDAVIHTSSLGVVSYEAKRLLSRTKLKNPIRRTMRFVNNLLENYF